MSHYDDVRELCYAKQELERLEEEYQSCVDKKDWLSCDLLSERITQKEKHIEDLKSEC